MAMTIHYFHPIACPALLLLFQILLFFTEKSFYINIRETFLYYFLWSVVIGRQISIIHVLIWMHIAVVVIDFIKRPAFTGEIA